MLSELWPRRELILSLVRRDLKTRYKSSVLGFLWSFCKPLLLMLVLFVVFNNFIPLRFDPPMNTPFALFLLIGILAWGFLAGSISEAMFSIVGNTSLVKKTYIPLEVFPVVTVLSNLFHFVLALIVYFLLLMGFGIFPTWHVVFLPAVIALHALFVLSLAMVLSALNVFYRDVASIMEIVVTAWFYLSPILYPLREPLRQIRAHQWPDGVFAIYMLNPMAAILAAYRKTVLLPATGDWEIGGTVLVGYLAVALVTTALLFLLGRAVFRHYAGRFADEV
ncbi:MAG: ABC transporter permease [Candidatus Sumerlaeia bacterium]|nr:ABC transporter permease [Candidatus Sumerlaeia bacterium]